MRGVGRGGDVGAGAEAGIDQPAPAERIQGRAVFWQVLRLYPDGSVRVEAEPEMGTNMLRLYEFVVNELRTPRLANVRNAVGVLTTLREGFESVREEANRLERGGELASVDRLQMVLTSA